MKAKPDPATKMLTAVCLGCGDVLYKKPNLPWFHDESGLEECDEPEPDGYV